MIDDVKQIVREAGQLLLRHFRNLASCDITMKDRGGLVTKADTESETFLMDRLTQLEPKAGILTEEAGEPKAGQSRWIIDPLDGTSNFASGIPCFSISVAYEQAQAESDVALGVVYQPVLNEMFYAVKGAGVFLNGEPVQVSIQKALSHAMVATGFYYHKGSVLHDAMAIFEEMQHHVLGVRRFGSAALDLAYVAAGRFDGFWETGLAPWDLAAGICMIREAGGLVTDYRGGPHSLYGTQTVAASPTMHQQLIDIIQRHHQP